MTLIVADEMNRLEALSIRELKQEYERLYEQQCKSHNKRWLVRKIIWRLQANAEGDLSERARRRAEELADDAEVRVTLPKDFAAPKTVSKKVRTPTDPRLPSVGTSITREYKGKTLEVRVLKDGFEYAGEKFKSLSAVAKEITGSHLNGFRFFRLEARR
jgi:hypothetical protein